MTIEDKLKYLGAMIVVAWISFVSSVILENTELHVLLKAIMIFIVVFGWLLTIYPHIYIDIITGRE